MHAVLTSIWVHVHPKKSKCTQLQSHTQTRTCALSSCVHMSVWTHTVTCDILFSPAASRQSQKADICSSLQDVKTPTHTRMHVSAHRSQYAVHTTHANPVTGPPQEQWSKGVQFTDHDGPPTHRVYSYVSVFLPLQMQTNNIFHVNRTWP